MDSIFACFYLTGQLKLIQQKFQLAWVVLGVSNPHVFNLTGQLESKPWEFPTLAATDPMVMGNRRTEKTPPPGTHLRDFWRGKNLFFFVPTEPSNALYA